MQIDETTQQILSQIVSANSGVDINAIEGLVEATNVLKGCKFISMRGYNSDASDNTEIANHLINIGFIYENMKAKNIDLLVNNLTGDMLVNTQNINLDEINYSLINLNGKSLDAYKDEVRGSYAQAYSELITSATTIAPVKENNDIYLNNVLVFNTNTGSLSIIGQSISKSVIVEAEPKITKKGAKTLAKELIQKAAGLKTNSYRRFKIENLQNVKISGETIDIS